ncbi:MAG: XdhC family protein, partial [Bacteroidota bacterium]
SYRRIGARMLVRSSGLWTGGISGGCLEGDALKRSQKAIFKGAASKVVYDTMEDDKNQIGVGLGCNGRIEVLFTPIDPHNPENEIEQLKRVAITDRPSIFVKIIDAPEESGLLGKKKLVATFGLIPDWEGIPSSQLATYVEQTIKKKKPKVFFTQIEDQPVKLLVEFIRPETRLIIVGDNYDVMAMLGTAQHLGWETYVVGKAKKLSKEVYKMAKKVVDYSQASDLPVHDYTAVMLMSHDYGWDKKMLPLFAAKQPAYMGMLGPKKRFHKMDKDLSDLDLEGLDFFYSPTGLEIGAESPEEIALSIAAEIVAVMRNKPGGFLKFKEGTIHERDPQTV